MKVELVRLHGDVAARDVEVVQLIQDAANLSFKPIPNIYID
jgi:hypothetical protein